MVLRTITTVGVDGRQRIDVACSIVRAIRGSVEGSGDRALDEAERRIGGPLPTGQRAGDGRLLASEGMNAQDRFVTPDRLRVEDGFPTFRVENQGCAFWAVRADDPVDPVVWIGPAGADGQPAGGRVSSFFVHTALREAAMAPLHTANAPSTPEAPGVLRASFGPPNVEDFVFWPNVAGASASTQHETCSSGTMPALALAGVPVRAGAGARDGGGRRRLADRLTG